jgi:glycine betaine/choline ABC-type transport system substrate-binding protein
MTNIISSLSRSTLIKKETLEKYPELRGNLNKLTGLITDEEMRN